MSGPLHAVALLGLLAVTLIAVGIYASWPSAARAAGAIVASAGSALVIVVATAHGCGLGEPFTQWLVPSLCLALVVALVGRPMVRRILVTMMLIAGASLSWQYAADVHGPTYVGEERPDPHYGIRATKAEWHTWLTGLYRRVE